MGLKGQGPDPLRDLTNKYVGTPLRNFFRKPKAPGEDPATTAARAQQISELGKTNEDQNYLIKKLMLAQRGFRPFGAPAPVSQSSGGIGGFAAPQTGADAPGTGIGSSAARVFGSLRRGGLPGNFRSGNR